LKALLALGILALIPALVSVLPPSLLPEALAAIRRESSAVHRTFSVARVSVLALAIVALVQECNSVFANGLSW
jgi:hypothetical protein